MMRRLLSYLACSALCRRQPKCTLPRPKFLRTSLTRNQYQEGKQVRPAVELAVQVLCMSYQLEFADSGYCNASQTVQ